MGVVAAPLIPERAFALPASKGQAADVGSYLPKAGVDDFVEFTAMKDMTPVSLIPTQCQSCLLLSASFLDLLPCTDDIPDTQAIRAGTIDVSKDPYHFALPPSWKQGKVANIQSGNFCQVPIS